ncbi:7tm Odorant receptor [Popillia japonica]|uniref:7tm Odorant receptor n=1 Tax=Popillia japonica TaxID=7064 RepID=A0AAW1I8T1_POPJA
MDGFPPGLGKVSRYIPYLMSYHFQLYIYCMWGQQVFDQVCSVCDVIYQSEWHLKYQPKLAKGMLLVMKVSQIQNKLTIGDMWKLNLATFMSVIKTSMSFHAFMQTVYKGDEVLVEACNQTMV